MRKDGLQILFVVFIALWFIAGHTTYTLAGMSSGPCHHVRGDGQPTMHSCATEQHEALQGGGCCCGGSGAPCDCEVKESRDADQELLPVSSLHTARTNQSGTGITNPQFPLTLHTQDNLSGMGWVQARAPSEGILASTTRLLR